MIGLSIAYYLAQACVDHLTLTLSPENYFCGGVSKQDSIPVRESFKSKWMIMFQRLI